MGSLILVRHATTDASAAGRNLGQRSDLPLSADGVELAARLGVALGAELAELPHDELRLISSPARRCRETAGAIAEALALDDGAVALDANLWEIDYGAWEGLTADECRSRDPELRARWERDPYATRCPGGESGSDVAARIAQTLDPLEAWLGEDRARCAIVVAHNHVIRLRMCDLLGWPLREYRERLIQEPGGYSMVTFGAEAPVVRRVNATPG